MRYFVMICEAALIVVATIILAVPEAHTPPMSFLLNALWLVVGVAWLIQMRKDGLLGMTVKETYRTASARPMARLLTFVALMLSFFATVVPTFR